MKDKLIFCLEFFLALLPSIIALAPFYFNNYFNKEIISEQTGLVYGAALVLSLSSFFLFRIFSLYSKAEKTIEKIDTGVINCTQLYSKAEGAIKKIDAGSEFLSRFSETSEMRPYRTIMDHHFKLEDLAPAFTTVLIALFSNVSQTGLILKGSVNQYFKILEESRGKSKKSFMAILSSPQSPWWCFESNDDDDITSAKKIAHLDAIKKISVTNKKRFLVYDWQAEIMVDGKSQTPFSPFSEIFIKKMDDVKKFLSVSGQWETHFPVNHFLFDWTFKINHPSDQSDQYKILFDAIQSVIDQKLDCAIIDDVFVIQQSPGSGLHVILPEDKKSCDPMIITDSYGNNESCWIPLTEAYLDKCASENKLLGNAEYNRLQKSNLNL